MPWQASSPVEERLKFAARLIEGKAIFEECPEFGSSRNNGHNIFNRGSGPSTNGPARDNMARRPRARLQSLRGPEEWRRSDPFLQSAVMIGFPGS